MIASEKSHQNQSEYNYFLFKNYLKFIKKHIYSCEKMRNSDKCIYNYAQSFFGKDF